MAIREAKRAGARLVIALAGISGGGKTFSALQLAWGLANGNSRKVGFLDTENKRGSLYADSLRGNDGKVHPFLIDDLVAPFTPQRYIDAILEFQAAGVEVLVIDTVSHEWAGLGGVLSMVAGYEKSVTAWKKCKPEHQRFVNTMLQSDMHIIVCVRATNKTDWKDPKNPKALCILPIQQEEFIFEMIASMMMWNGGKSRDVLKCPADLAPILGETGATSDGYLTARHGLAIRKWIDGGEERDAAAENARNSLLSIADQGADAVRAAWGKLTKAARKALGDQVPADILASAEAFDAARKDAQPGGADLADLNDDVLGDQTQAAA